MAKFNTVAKDKKKTKSHEGAVAYSMPAKLELYSLVCNSLVADKFYESGPDAMKRISSLITQVEPMFVSNLAAYARNEMNLRSIPVVLAVGLCMTVGGGVARECVSRVCKRVDEITEVISFFGSVNPNATKTKPLTKMPKSLSKGIKEVFESGRFNEYAFAKYDRATSVKLRDAIFLSHPKPTSKSQETLFKKIIAGELDVPYTWETELSKAGQELADKTVTEKKAGVKKVWSDLIKSKKVGYMAVLRNLRNILEADVSKTDIATVCEFLSDEKQAVNSKQFPFRFWSAYKSVRDASDLADVDMFKKEAIMTALSKAILSSIKCYPDFEGKTFVVSDVSGSMDAAVSPKSEVKRVDIGVVLGSLMAMNRPEDTIMGIFGSELKVLPKCKDIFDNIEKFSQNNGLGYGTNGHLAIDYLLKKEIFVNRIMFFTDMQMSQFSGSFVTTWRKYRKTISPDAEMWFFDLAGYGNTPIRFESDGMKIVAGWSDRVFEMAKNIENGESVVASIENYDYKSTKKEKPSSDE